MKSSITIDSILENFPNSERVEIETHRNRAAIIGLSGIPLGALIGTATYFLNSGTVSLADSVLVCSTLGSALGFLAGNLYEKVGERISLPYCEFRSELRSLGGIYRFLS